MTPASSTATPRFSIIIATYQTRQEHLDALVRSLHAQTLDPTQFEVILADDGSDTETRSRLRDTISQLGRARLLELENSGWACGPRNEGIAVAEGEFVLFMDHDDVLFPEALERVARFAEGGAYDVINPREVRTKHWSWAWDVFDAPDADEQSVALRMMPMTPHKFYRRAFLQENEITFIAERRVLWEDVFFNTACIAAEARVGVLRDYPVYHWVEHDANTSSGFGRDRGEVWDAISQLLAAFRRSLPGDESEALIAHWLRTRVLDIAGPRLLDASPTRRDIDVERASDIVRNVVAPSLLDRLGTVQRMRARALQAQPVDEKTLLALAEFEKGVSAHTTIVDISWHASVLHLATETTFRFRDVELQLRRGAGGIIEAMLPYATSSGALWIPFDLANRIDDVSITVRGRKDRQTWPISMSRLSVEPGEGESVRLMGRAVTEWAVAEFQQRVPNWSQPWDLAVRVALPLRTSHRALAAPTSMSSSENAIIGSASAVAYRNVSGGLTVDLGGSAKNALGAQRPTLQRLAARQGTARVRIPLDLPVANTPPGAQMAVRLTNVDAAGYDLTLDAALVEDANGGSIGLDVPTDTNGRWSILALFGHTWVKVGELQIGKRPVSIGHRAIRSLRRRARRLFRR